MKFRTFLLFILILNINTLNGQILETICLNEHIGSVQFSPQGFDLGYPILSQEKQTPLLLEFDLIEPTETALAYRLIHCDANWKKSALLTTDFLENSFNEFYIESYALSSSTQRLYTHYTITISQESLKLSGNYIVQVFPENNPETTWLQTRFVYAESLLNIVGTVQRAADSRYHQTHQRVQFEVAYDKAKFPHPRTNLKAVVSQNFRWDNAQILSPLFISPQTLRFTYIDKKGLFAANYEFPYFDSSNILQETHSIRTLEKDENGETHCYLYPNETAANNYFYLKDMNGNFAIKAENTFQTNTEADYIWVHFTLMSKELPSQVFVVGRFNQWQPSASNQLAYDKDLELYHIGLLLKQGVYNYTFVTQETDGDLHNLLGSYSETENDYYIFIYYKDERLQTDRLVGWKRINSRK